MAALVPERAMYETGAIRANRGGDRIVEETGQIAAALAQQSAGESFFVFEAGVT
jgi:hypothetical protein